MVQGQAWVEVSVLQENDCKACFEPTDLVTLAILLHPFF